MKETKTRRSILKTLHHYDKYTKKEIIFKLSWIEILFNLIGIIIILFLVIYEISYLEIIIPIIVWIIIFLLIIDIKISHKNILQILIDKYEQYLNKNNYYENTISCNNKIININNESFQIRKLKFLNVSKNDLSILNNIFSNEEYLEFQIISICNGFYLDEYINKIKNNIIQNHFLHNHEDYANSLNIKNIKRENFIIFKNLKDLGFLIKNKILEINEIDEKDKKIVTNFYDELNALQNNNLSYRNYLYHNKKVYYLLSISEIKNIEISLLLNLLTMNLNVNIVIYNKKINDIISMEILKSSNQFKIYLNKNKKNEDEKYNELLHEFSNSIRNKEIFLIDLQITLIFWNENIHDLNNEIEEFKLNLSKIFNFEKLILISKENAISKLIQFNPGRWECYGTFITSDQLILSFMNFYLIFLQKDGFIIGEDERKVPILFNQEYHLLKANDNKIFNGISLILGKSGSGKSILIKKIIYLSYFIKKQKIIIFDVENEYQILLKTIHKSLKINVSSFMLDPFKIIFEDKNEKIIFLNSILNSFSKKEIDWTIDLIKYLNFSNNANFWHFIEFIKSQNINNYEYVKLIDKEIYKNMFSANNINLNEYDLIILDFKSLFDKEILKNNNVILTILITTFTYISLFVFNNKNEKIHLVIDEAYKFFNLKNDFIEDIWFSLIKKSRKYKTLLTFSTQNYDDLFFNKFSNRIINNVQYLFLGRMNEFELKSFIQNNPNLDTDHIKEEFISNITNLSKAEFLMSKNNKDFVKIKNIIDDDILEKYY